jgi:hypothetical protein
MKYLLIFLSLFCFACVSQSKFEDTTRHLFREQARMQGDIHTQTHAAFECATIHSVFVQVFQYCENDVESACAAANAYIDHCYTERPLRRGVMAAMILAVKEVQDQASAELEAALTNLKSVVTFTRR